MNEYGWWVFLGLGLIQLVFIFLVFRLRSDKSVPHDPVLQAQRQEVLNSIQNNSERLERELRREVNESARAGRQETTQNLATFQQTLVQQSAEATRTQNTQIDAFGQQLAGLQKSLSDTLSTQLTGLSESNARRLAEIRQTLDIQLAQLQTTNAAKLDEMRATVDEKLQSTLQARLGESFKQVADRLNKCTRA